MPTRSPPSAAARIGWQHIADLLRLAIVVIGIGASIAGDAATAIKCVLLLPPAVASRLVAARPAWGLAFTVALAVEALASATGLNGIAGWNTMAHLVLPFLSGPLLYSGLERLGVRVDAEVSSRLRARIAAGVVTFTSVLATGALWELVEWAADTWFGTHFATSYDDTVMDLLHDALAAFASGVVIARRPVTQSQLVCARGTSAEMPRRFLSRSKR
jgi:hypothetical protein